MPTKRVRDAWGEKSQPLGNYIAESASTAAVKGPGRRTDGKGETAVSPGFASLTVSKTVHTGQTLLIIAMCCRRRSTSNRIVTEHSAPTISAAEHGT